MVTQSDCRIETHILYLLVEGYLVRSPKVSDRCYAAMQSIGPDVADFIRDEANSRYRNKAQRQRLLCLARDLGGLVQRSKDFSTRLNSALIRCVSSTETEVHLRAIRILSQMPDACSVLIAEAFVHQSEPKVCIRLLESAGHLGTPAFMSWAQLKMMVAGGRSPTIREAAAQLMATLGAIHPYAGPAA